MDAGNTFRSLLSDYQQLTSRFTHISYLSSIIPTSNTNYYHPPKGEYLAETETRKGRVVDEKVNRSSTTRNLIKWPTQLPQKDRWHLQYPLTSLQLITRPLRNIRHPSRLEKTNRVRAPNGSLCRFTPFKWIPWHDLYSIQVNRNDPADWRRG